MGWLNKWPYASIYTWFGAFFSTSHIALWNGWVLILKCPLKTKRGIKQGCLYAYFKWSNLLCFAHCLWSSQDSALDIVAHVLYMCICCQSYEQWLCHIGISQNGFMWLLTFACSAWTCRFSLHHLTFFYTCTHHWLLRPVELMLTCFSLTLNASSSSWIAMIVYSKRQ